VDVYAGHEELVTGDRDMHVAESWMIASVGSMIFGSSRLSTRTSPGPYMTT
jgi:hypothetical protein